MHIIFVMVLNVDRFQFYSKNYTISYAYMVHLGEKGTIQSFELNTGLMNGPNSREPRSLYYLQIYLPSCWDRCFS